MGLFGIFRKSNRKNEINTSARFVDEVFGEFKFDKRLNCFEGAIECEGRNIRVTVPSEGDMAALRFICKNLNDFIEEASHYRGIAPINYQYQH